MTTNWIELNWKFKEKETGIIDLETIVYHQHKFNKYIYTNECWNNRLKLSIDYCTIW